MTVVEPYSVQRWKAAIKKRDYSLCDKAAGEYGIDYKSDCLAGNAGLTGDIKACGRIKEEMNRKMCWDMKDMFLAEMM